MRTQKDMLTIQDRTRDIRNARISIFKRSKQPTGSSAKESGETRACKFIHFVQSKRDTCNSIKKGHECTNRILNSDGRAQMVESETMIPSPTSKPPEAPQENGLIPPLLEYVPASAPQGFKASIIQDSPATYQQKASRLTADSTSNQNPR